MNRREVFALGLSGTIAAWTRSAVGQQVERLRRIGVIMSPAQGDTEGEARLAAFRRGLAERGWIEGRGILIDVRWAAGERSRIRAYAEELLALSPDAVLVTGSAGVRPMLRATKTVPVVFAAVPDPLGAGFVSSLARPGGNATGFTSYGYDIGTKWLELLKEISPATRRVAVIVDPAIATGIGQWNAIEAIAPSFDVELTRINAGHPREIERALEAFGRSSNGGMIVTGSPSAGTHRDVIIATAARERLPGIYYARFFIAAGGLISYGTDYLDQYRGAAGYVDRILKGERPSDLPVQAPTKYEMVMNLKTAKALSLTIPPSLLARADEVIE